MLALTDSESSKVAALLASATTASLTAAFDFDVEAEHEQLKTLFAASSDCDSDGNRFDDIPQSGLRSLACHHAQEDQGANDANDARPSKVLIHVCISILMQIHPTQRGASKKALLEMRKQSERLLRGWCCIWPLTHSLTLAHSLPEIATHIELPARRGNLDISKFLSLYNIQR